MRALLILILLAAPASAATLRPFTTLTHPVVRLSDLWSGVVHDREIGPAPPPGARILVGVEQLAAIARQFGVAWSPDAGNDQAILERAGQPLARDAMLAAVRAALHDAGAPANAEVEVPAFAAPLVPTGSEAQPVVSDLNYDHSTGQFTALLSVTAAGMAPVQSRVGGRVVPMQDLPVPIHAIAAGEILQSGDIRMARVRAASWAGALVRSSDQVDGMASRRALAEGQPIAVADLQRPILVRKGAIVSMRLATPGITVTAQGIAMEPASLSDPVRVLNPNSQMLVQAIVIGPGLVQVIPGTSPVKAGAGTAWALTQAYAR